MVRWISLDEPVRKKHFCELFSYIRLPLINSMKLAEIIAEHQHLTIERCFRCCQYLLNASLYQLNGQNRNLQHFQTCGRKSGRRIILAGGGVFQTLCLGDLCEIASANVAKTHLNGFAYSSMTIVNNVVYWIALQISNKAFKCAYKSDNVWREIPAMPNSHNDGLYHSYTVALNECIFIIGGIIQNKAVALVDCFDTNENQWKKFPNMINQRADATAVAHNRDIYVVGGCNTTPLLNSAEMFSYRDQIWKLLPNMLECRKKCGLEMYHGKLFAVGGTQNKKLSAVETYQIGDNAWVKIDNLNIARSSVGCILLQNKLYVVGGERGSNTPFYET